MDRVFDNRAGPVVKSIDFAKEEARVESNIDLKRRQRRSKLDDGKNNGTRKWWMGRRDVHCHSIVRKRFSIIVCSRRTEGSNWAETPDPIHHDRWLDAQTCQ